MMVVDWVSYGTAVGGAFWIAVGGASNTAGSSEETIGDFGRNHDLTDFRIHRIQSTVA